MMKNIIRIGSRDSQLAVIQAEIVRNTIKRVHPELKIEIVTMKTTGDLILDRNLDQIGGKGLFVKELDQALMDGRIDISVHSLKDMPMEISEELPILAYTKRDDPRDILLYKPGTESIPARGVIGTSSNRRTLQLQKIFPSCTFPGIRGNIQTRLKKLEEEPYDGIVLAAAGIRRLGMHSHSSRIFKVTEILPSAGQGILAVQGRREEDDSYLQCVMHPESTIAAKAERRFVQALNGGCSSPIAAYAEVSGQEIRLTGLYYDETAKQSVIETMIGETSHCEQIGEALARQLKRRF
ncbi:MAG: hydroxymethylbilane synthase [Lachnospiraceae bacterium]